MKIYYITRTYPPFHKGGGALMREGAVNHLRALGWEVTVVMPNYGSKEIIEVDGLIRTPLKHFQELSLLRERFGFFEDYLDPWVSASLPILTERVTADDIVFATTGSELGTVKLGSLVRQKTGCRLVVNYRDPIMYAIYENKIVDKKRHVNRDRMEAGYINNADLILTSSDTFRDALIEKYPQLEEKIYNNYFGYLNDMDISAKKNNSRSVLRIAYAGRIGNYQKPELLIEAARRSANSDKIELYFLGDFSRYSPLKNIKNVRLIPLLPHAEFTRFMLENVDVGFVSLADEFFKFCVPSKIYEYLNLGIPILGALADGDARNIIIENQFGFTCHFNDYDCLGRSIDLFFDKERYGVIRENIIREREKWSMAVRIMEVDKLLKKLVVPNPDKETFENGLTDR